MRLVPLIAALLLSACAARTNTFGATASGGDPPLLPPGVQVPLYDHYCAEFINSGRGAERELTRLLDTASAEGWEMVAVAVAENVIFCFKRPRVTATAAPGAVEPPTPPTP